MVTVLPSDAHNVFSTLQRSQMLVLVAILLLVAIRQVLGSVYSASMVSVELVALLRTILRVDIERLL